MDPREELYQALKERLSNIEEIKHVDLWNSNIDFLEEEEPWQRPAVFIQFMPIKWNVMRDSFRGFGELRLHTVVDWSQDAPIEAWQLTDKIWQELTRIEGEYFSGTYPDQTIPNVDHNAVFENIDVFQVRYIKPWIEDDEDM